jgi:hypothetical protein
MPAVIVECAGPRTRVIDEPCFTVPVAHGRPASMRLQVYTGPGLRPVMVATQAEREGLSLTNGAIGFASAAWRRYLPEQADPPLWIQRQLLESMTPAFALVRFERTADRYGLARPQWVPLREAEMAQLVGEPVDTGRGPGYRPLPDEPVAQPRFQVMLVARLARPDPFREPGCMPAGTSWPRRLARQLAPCPAARSCCWYHGGDWRPVCSTAIAVARRARRADVPVEQVAEQAARLGAGNLTGWPAEALDSLLTIGVAIQPRPGGYINGQHRAQAMLDAGVRWVLVVRWDEPSTL